MKKGKDVKGKEGSLQKDSKNPMGTTAPKHIAFPAFITALLLFSFIVYYVFVAKEEGFDRLAFRFFDTHLPPSFYPFVRAFTFFGNPEFLIPLYVALVTYFLIRRQKRYALQFGLLGATSTGLLFGVKALFERARPEEPVFELLSAYSFPSGHALLSCVLCSFLSYRLWHSTVDKGWKWVLTGLLLLFSLALGFSRVILKVHFATDVIAGFCLGYAWVFTGWWVQRMVLSEGRWFEYGRDN